MKMKLFYVIWKRMERYIHSSCAKKSGTPITATYGVEGNTIDMEFLMPIDRSIASTDRFVFKNQIKIVNAVVACYKGHPMGLQEACNQLNQYIVEHKLQPITVGYNVTKKTDILNPENTEIDVWELVQTSCRKRYKADLQRQTDLYKKRTLINLRKPSESTNVKHF